jgi:hypothetical protein
MGPAKKTPTKAPHCPDWKRALCHLVGIVKPSCPATLTPYFFWKAGSATKLPFRNMSKDSIT